MGKAVTTHAFSHVGQQDYYTMVCYYARLYRNGVLFIDVHREVIGRN